MERVKTSRPTIGVDEVGRGCLAGDVFAAAVLEPTEHFEWWSEIRDSKKLSAKKREKLAELITENCDWCVQQISSYVIDEINILQASLQAMRSAVGGVLQTLEDDPLGAAIRDEDPFHSSTREDKILILVDGNCPLSEIPPHMDQECIKGGDDIVKCIGAASILAKVSRDAYMQTMHAAHPYYGWDRNKGYGTAEHREAIMVHGVTPLHRRSFRGVAEYV